MVMRATKEEGEEEWDEYNVEDDTTEPVTNRTDKVIRDAMERAVRKSTTTTATARPTRPLAPRLNPTMLLGDRGFRKLRQMSTKIQFTNDTVRNLDTFMTIYRDWAHQMYPKFVFRDFIDKIERQCRLAPMKAYLLALKRAGEEGDQRFDEVQYAAELNAADVSAVLANDPTAMREEFESKGMPMQGLIPSDPMEE
jgi:hypothetical protein